MMEEQTIQLPKEQFHLLIRGSVIKALRRLASKSVDVCITSPPYWSLRDYGTVESVIASRRHLAEELAEERAASLDEHYNVKGHFPGQPYESITEFVAFDATIGVGMPAEARNWKCAVNFDMSDVWGGDESCQHEWAETGGIRRSWGDTSSLENSKQGTVRGAMSNVDALTKHSDFCSKCHAWKGCLGLEPTFKLYIDHIKLVAEELKRVLKDTGTFYLNMGDTYAGSNSGRNADGTVAANMEKYPSQAEAIPSALIGRLQSRTELPNKSLMLIPERVAIALEDEGGWVCRNARIWHKPNSMPSSVKDRYANTYEFIFFFAKAKGLECEDYWFDLNAIREPHKTLMARQAAEGASFASEDASHDEAVGRYPNASYKDPMHEKAANPAGKNPGDTLDAGSQQKWEEAPLGAPSFARAKHSGYYSSLDGHLLVNPAGKNPGDVLDDEQRDKTRDRELFQPEQNPSKRLPPEPNQHNAFHPEGKNPGDTYETKGEDAIGWGTRNQTQKAERDQSRLSGDPELVRWVHDHGGNPQGKNPGDTLEAATAKRGWASATDICFKMGYDHHVPELHKKRPTTLASDYLEVNTEPYPESHFAVFPTKIVEQPIKASCPPEICNKCGKARERIAERIVDYKAGGGYFGAKANIVAETRSASFRVQANLKALRDATGIHDSVVSHATVGWTDCGCHAGFHPGVVLDIFGGSGTTAFVAKKLSRSSILIDKKPEYLDMQKERLEFGQPTLDAIQWLEEFVD